MQTLCISSLGLGTPALAPLRADPRYSLAAHTSVDTLATLCACAAKASTRRLFKFQRGTMLPLAPGAPRALEAVQLGAVRQASSRDSDLAQKAIAGPSPGHRRAIAGPSLCAK